MAHTIMHMYCISSFYIHTSGVVNNSFSFENNADTSANGLREIVLLEEPCKLQGKFDFILVYGKNENERKIRKLFAHF